MAIVEREIAPQTRKRLYMEDEYLTLEQKAAEKSEYVNGEIRLVSGGMDYHGALAMNHGSASSSLCAAEDALSYFPM